MNGARGLIGVSLGGITGALLAVGVFGQAGLDGYSVAGSFFGAIAGLAVVARHEGRKGHGAA